MEVSLCQGGPVPTPVELAAALQQARPPHTQRGAEGDAMPRRVLRFLLGGFLRRGQRSSSTDGAPQGELLLQASGSMPSASELGEGGADVLGMSPFASIEDMQAYRRQLQERQERRQQQKQQQQQQQQQQSLALRQQQAQHQHHRPREPGGPGPLRRALCWLLHHARSAARHFRPQGVGPNDAQIAERIANVLTSVPFVLIGASIFRSSSSRANRHSGASFIGCGVVAALYHSSPPGAARRALRKLDYWSICYTSGVLRAAAGLRAPAALRAAAALATPVKPTLVTGANLLAIEARYLASALRDSRLRRAFGAHVSAAAAGVACFLLDDLLVLEKGWPPFFHPSWHVLSSVSLGLIGPLLSHCEGALLLEGVQALVAA